jgi:hypothetical protein
MHEQKRQPEGVMRLWRSLLKPSLDAWLYLESLGRLVLTVVAVGVFVVSGVAYARHWLAEFWFAVVVAMAIVVVMLPWVLYWKARAGGTHEKRSVVDKQQEPVSVEYAGIRWVHTGGFYWGTGDPIGRAECPEHKVRLFYRDLSSEKTREPHDSDSLGSYRGALFCVDGGGHRLEAPEEFAGKSFGELQREAEALLEARLPER